MKPKNKVGRPRAKIDAEQVEKLASMQCTYEEIASFFGVSKSTISDNFRTEITKGRSVGKISLRRNQFKLSETNATMAIWLGKQYLDQKDYPDYGGDLIHEIRINVIPNTVTT